MQQSLSVAQKDRFSLCVFLNYCFQYVWIFFQLLSSQYISYTILGSERRYEQHIIFATEKKALRDIILIQEI